MVFFQILSYAMALAFFLMLGLGVQLIRMGRAGIRVRAQARPIQLAIWLHAFLNSVAAFTWITTLIEILPLRTRIPISDYGAPLGAIALLLLVPIGLSVCRILKRQGRFVDAPSTLKNYTRLSNVFLLVSLYPGVQTILFYTLLSMSNR